MPTVDHEKLAARISLGKKEQEQFPQKGTCYRCGCPWIDSHPPHTTPYSETRGCFPLCAECWSELSPEDRLPYYRELWIVWQQGPGGATNEVWESIKAAVLRGE